MDVYVISDVQSFLDSVTTTPGSITTLTPETPSEVGVDGRGGQAMLTALPSIFLLLIVAGALIL